MPRAAIGRSGCPEFCDEGLSALSRTRERASNVHDLRHSAASWMLAAGVDVGSVARILGHTTPSATLGIYAHALPVAEAQAVAAIDERLGRTK